MSVWNDSKLSHWSSIGEAWFALIFSPDNDLLSDNSRISHACDALPLASSDEIDSIPSNGKVIISREYQRCDSSEGGRPGNIILLPIRALTY